VYMCLFVEHTAERLEQTRNHALDAAVHVGAAWSIRWNDR